MSLRERLRSDLSDPEFRHAYADENLNLSIATQIRVLREMQHLSQKELAEKIGTKQAGVSRLESASYSGWSVRILKKLAEAFDLRLRISFEEFGTLWREVDDFSKESMERRSFNEDPEFHEAAISQSNDTSQQHGIPEGSLASVTSVLRQPTAAEQGMTSTGQSPSWGGPRKPSGSAIANWSGNRTNEMKVLACM